MRPSTAIALVALALALSPSLHGDAQAGPPTLPQTPKVVPDVPRADFEFVVPVAVDSLHREAVSKGVWVVCNIYDHTVAEREQAYAELEAHWTLAKAEEIQRWHLGHGKAKLAVSKAGSFDGKVTVEVDADPKSGEATDARSWECHLAITPSKLPTRDTTKEAWLRAKPGTRFTPLRRGDL